MAGLRPYLPLPGKLTTSVLDPMWPKSGKTADAFGDRVEAATPAAFNRMPAGRKLLLG